MKTLKKFTQNPSTQPLLLAALLSLSLQGCGGGNDASSVATLENPATAQAAALPAATSTTTTTTSTAAPQPIAAITTAPNNVFTKVCSGITCGATSATQYNGVDVGLWQYNNTSTTDAYININIAGVSAGKKVTLAFANGNKNQALMTPSIGINGSSSLKTPAVSTAAFDFKAINAAYYNALSAQEQRRDTLQNEHDAAHSNIQHRHQLTLKALEAERVAVSKLPRQQAEALFNQSLAAQKILAAPALNATRTWLDTYPTTPVSYPTINKFVCALPSGRSLVFWQDTAATMSATTLKYFTDNSCGASGTFARLNTLLGDVWGAHNYSNLIKDTATAKQDINIVFLNMGTTTNLAGYFDSSNSFTSGTNSSKSLAFFVNAARVDLDPQFYLSTLIHEATHMTAFYQNTVVRNKSWNDIWLDEVFAMMSEDIVVPAVTGYDKVLNTRVPKYLLSGANLSLNNWPMLSSSHYSMGATFGAFLNRRYGLSVYQQLITGCTATTALKTNAYDCLNSLIVKNGGTGMTEELGKMGATVFSRASASNALPGYGFGSKLSGGYTLMGLDLSGYTLADPLPMTSYGSMSQTYLNETVAIGVTRYIRSNVRVPARTRLDLVIK
jgi:hypothetical protein